MYKIKAEGKEYYSDTLVYVKKAPNGCYVPCLAEEAEYVVGKIPIETEDGMTVEDTVFSRDAVEWVDGSLTMKDMQEALSILGVT